jgi:hypothetical protein
MYNRLSALAVIKIAFYQILRKGNKTMFAIPTSISRKTLLLAFSVFLCVFNISANVNGPYQGRTLQEDPLPSQPVEITGVKIKGKPVKFGSPLGDDIDWLRGLTVRVKNISGKPINFISFQLRINPPEPGSLTRVVELMMAGSIFLLMDNEPQAVKVLVMPDKFTEITFDDRAYDLNKDKLQSPIVYFRVGRVLFEDDTLWFDGRLYRRDPKDPSRWNAIE